MTILIAVAAALGLLYFWLLGHWFARVVMFLLFGMGGVAIGLMVATDIMPPPHITAQATTRAEFIADGNTPEAADFLVRTGAALPVKQPGTPMWPGIIGPIVGIGLAWPLASIPIYSRRRRA